MGRRCFRRLIRADKGKYHHGPMLYVGQELSLCCSLAPSTPAVIRSVRTGLAECGLPLYNCINISSYRHLCITESMNRKAETSKYISMDVSHFHSGHPSLANHLYGVKYLLNISVLVEAFRVGGGSCVPSSPDLLREDPSYRFLEGSLSERSGLLVVRGSWICSACVSSDRGLISLCN
jgi:hypothetical protein